MMNRLAVGLALILVGIPARAFGCSCEHWEAARPCSLMKDSSEVMFVGTLLSVENSQDDSKTAAGQSGEARYTFRVEESLAGVTASQLDIYSGRGGGDCSVRFTVGEKYLIDSWRGEDRRVFVSTCSRTRKLFEASTLLPQLRAMRDGGRPDSLFGMLRREMPSVETSEADPNQYLGGRTIRLRSSDHAFETKSDGDGRYSFRDLPAGEYSVSVDLPAGFVLVGDTIDSLPKTLVVAADACGEHDLIALPTAQISGRVVAPNRSGIGDRPAAGVMLVRADRYRANPNESYRWAFLRDGYFVFKHVVLGDYFVVYNYKDRIDDMYPFPKTFYPSAVDVEHASKIHIGEGEKLPDILIRLPAKSGSPN